MPYVCKLNEVEILFLMIVLALFITVAPFQSTETFLISSYNSNLNLISFQNGLLLLPMVLLSSLNWFWIRSELDASIFERYKGDRGPIREDPPILLSYLSVASNRLYDIIIYTSTVHASVTSPFLPILNKIRLFFRTLRQTHTSQLTFWRMVQYQCTVGVNATTSIEYFLVFVSRFVLYLH